MLAASTSVAFLKSINDAHFKTLAKELLATGFKLKRSSRHLVFGNGTATIILPKTTSDRKAWKNKLSTIKHDTGLDFSYLFKGKH